MGELYTMVTVSIKREKRFIILFYSQATSQAPVFRAGSVLVMS